MMQTFSLDRGLYSVKLDLSLLFPIIVCCNVLIFKIQVEFLVCTSGRNSEALLVLEIKWSCFVTCLSKLRTTYPLFVPSQS